MKPRGSAVELEDSVISDQPVVDTSASAVRRRRLLQKRRARAAHAQRHHATSMQLSEEHEDNLANKAAFGTLEEEGCGGVNLSDHR